MSSSQPVTRRSLMAAALVVLFFAAIGSAQIGQLFESGRQTTCKNNLRNLALALISYDSQFNQLPGFHDFIKDGNGRVLSRPLLYAVFPQLERNDLYEQSSAANYPHDGVKETFLGLLICPSASKWSEKERQGVPMNYLCNTGMPDVPSAKAPPDLRANGVFQDRYLSNRLGLASGNNTLNYVNAKDGAANTLLMSERREIGRWTDTAEYDVSFVWHPPFKENPLHKINSKPQNAYATNKYVLSRPSSNHPGVVHVAFCDGHVRSLREKVEYKVYAQLLTCDGRRAALVDAAPEQSDKALAEFRDYVLNDKDYE
jgi:prepilin-type processing-associated H-X9-DG protein